MWIKIFDRGQLLFEGNLRQFSDYFKVPINSGSQVFNFIYHKNYDDVKIYEDGDWVEGKPNFDGMAFCCFKNPYTNTPPVIQGECTISGENVLFLNKIVTEVYGWLIIPECPFIPFN